MYYAHLVLKVELGPEIYHKYAFPLVALAGNNPTKVLAWCKQYCATQLPFLFLFDLPSNEVVDEKETPAMSESHPTAFEQHPLPF